MSLLPHPGTEIPRPAWAVDGPPKVRRKPARPARVLNDCATRDTSRPHARVVPRPPQCAADLTADQLVLLAETVARQGGHPADKIPFLFGFDPTPEDRLVIERATQDHPRVTGQDERSIID